MKIEKTDIEQIKKNITKLFRQSGKTALTNSMFRFRKKELLKN